MQRGVKRILPAPGNESPAIFDWERLHLTCFASVMGNWRQFINYLDREITKMVPKHASCIPAHADSSQFDEVILSKVDPAETKERSVAEHAHASMKRLQYLVDQASRTSHVLELNLDVMKLMIERLSEARDSDGLTGFLIDKDILREIQQRCSEHTFARKNINSILHRAYILSNQVSFVKL